MVGFRSEAAAIEIAIGTMIAALAVLLVVSDTSTEITTTTTVTPNSVETPSESEIDSPNTDASPVSDSRVPSTRPPPNRITVPQSIWVASFQVRVNLRRAQSTGRTKRAPAARIA